MRSPQVGHASSSGAFSAKFWESRTLMPRLFAFDSARLRKPIVECCLAGVRRGNADGCEPLDDSKVRDRASASGNVSAWVPSEGKVAQRTDGEAAADALWRRPGQCRHRSERQRSASAASICSSKAQVRAQESMERQNKLCDTASSTVDSPSPRQAPWPTSCKSVEGQPPQTLKEFERHRPDSRQKF